MEDTSVPNGSPTLMRAINTARVIRELRTAGPMSRASLVRATGLSKPTITNIVASLDSMKYVERVAKSSEASASQKSEGGLYAYRASRGQVIGIDIGADKVLLLLADLAGTVLGSARFNVRATTRPGPGAIFDEIAKASSKLLTDAGGSQESLLAVVVGTPGVISPDGIVTMAPQLDGWEGLDLRAAVAALYTCPVIVQNEVSLSLEAERWRGVAQGINDALFVQLGIGVGAGVLVDGKIRNGADGGAGEIGQMPYPQRGEGGEIEFVPLESQASGGALLRRGQALAKTPAGAQLLRLANGNAADVDAFVVFKTVREGDSAATALMRDVIAILAWGISCVTCVLNPQTIVIGGGWCRAADLFLPDLQARVSTSVPFPPEWFVSVLGDEAVALGAVHRATEYVEQELFTTADPRRSL